MKKSRFILGLLSLTLMFSSCSDLFETKVSMNPNAKKSNLLEFLKKSSDIVTLQKPSQVFVSQGVYSNKISVRWSDVPKATSYVIERAIITKDSEGNYRDVEDDDFVVLNRYVYDTIYEDVILEEAGANNSEYNNRYYYRISAENIGEGHISSDYSEVKYGYLFAAAKKVEATKGKSTTEIKITWEKASGAIQYVIYRSEKSGGLGMEKLASIPANKNEYIDTIESQNQGKEYYYSVVITNSNSQYSALTTPCLGFTRRDNAPSAPDNVRVDNGRGTSNSSLTIKWDALDAIDGKTIAYYIYRNTKENTDYVLIKDNCTTNFYENKNVPAGTYYYYYVQAVLTDVTTGDVVKTAFSETGDYNAENPAMGFVVSPPTEIDVEEVTGGNILIKWKPALGYDLFATGTCPYTYNISTNDTELGNYTETYTWIDGTPDSDGYIKKEVEKANFYKITTENNGVKSSFSTVVAPPPSAAINVQASQNEKLEQNFEANSKGVYPVKITWDKPTDDNPAGYVVYRCETNNSDLSKWKKVATVTETSCIDQNKSSTPGTFYYYKVLSVNINGKGTHYSEVNMNCRGYGAITREAWFREFNKSIMHSQTKLYGMHHEKMDSEVKAGNIGGSVNYSGAVTMNPVGAYITMYYSSYSDFYMYENGERLLDRNYSSESTSNRFNHRYIDDLTAAEQAKCVEYFVLTGNTNTQAKADHSGVMDGTMTCTGMYPGKAIYNNIKVVNDKGGGGYYLVTTYDNNGNVILNEGKVTYLVGEEDTGYNYQD